MTDSQSERMTVEEARRALASAVYDRILARHDGACDEEYRETVAREDAAFDRLRQAILEEHQEKYAALVEATGALLDGAVFADGAVMRCVVCGQRDSDGHAGGFVCSDARAVLRAIFPTPVEEGGA